LFVVPVKALLSNAKYITGLLSELLDSKFAYNEFVSKPSTTDSTLPERVPIGLGVTTRLPTAAPAVIDKKSWL